MLVTFFICLSAVAIALALYLEQRKTADKQVHQQTSVTPTAAKTQTSSAAKVTARTKLSNPERESILSLIQSSESVEVDRDIKPLPDPFQETEKAEPLDKNAPRK